MKKLRLLAPWAVVATMIGLSACGGGGDAGEPLAPLTAGLTVTASTGNVPANGTYNLKVDVADVDDYNVNGSLIYNAYGATGPDADVYLFVQVDSTTYALQKVVLIDTNVSPMKIAGCGFSGFSCGSNVTVNTTTGEIRASRLQLKQLTPVNPNGNPGDVIVNPGTAVTTPNAGSLTASGILAPITPI